MVRPLQRKAAMKTYVAEINREAILAFRAETDEDAHQKMNGEEGSIPLGLNGFAGLLRDNGEVLWDGESEIETRLATEDEHERWSRALDAEIGAALDGRPIDPTASNDPNDFVAYLIPTKRLDAEAA
jgi:hypothetical protein